MDDLVQQLHDLEGCGSYRLHNTVEELQAAVEQAEFKLYVPDLEHADGKAAFITAIAQAADFYEGFPANWDALHDALCDLPPAPGYVFLFQHPPAGLTEAELSIVQTIFAETGQYWQTQSRPFWVFLA